MRIAPFFLLAASLAGAPPVAVIFDTDMGNDIDDALALAMIHALESRGEAKLIGVTLTKDNPYAAIYVDLVNHFYKRPGIPVGMVKQGKTPEESAFTRLPADKKTADGRPVYPRRLGLGVDAPDAAPMLRSLLEKQADGSVAIVQVGFSTNLARLLDQPGAAELIRRKVKVLSLMAGQFPDGKPEYNVRVDIAAAKKVFAEWPTPVVCSGWEVGAALLYPAVSIENDFRHEANHPIADGYRAYKAMPYDRPTWDLTSVLYAVRPERGYFSLSEPGKIHVDDEGKTRFESLPEGRHRYLMVDGVQRARVLEALVQLASQPRD
ncbi:MAG: nucleoside hydrolase [Bryobacterales bacterium]|nr:nucleoside hydrolase [Bryobacterales bacterium]